MCSVLRTVVYILSFEMLRIRADERLVGSLLKFYNVQGVLSIKTSGSDKMIFNMAKYNFLPSSAVDFQYIEDILTPTADNMIPVSYGQLAVIADESLITTKFVNLSRRINICLLIWIVRQPKGYDFVNTEKIHLTANCRFIYVTQTAPDLWKIFQLYKFKENGTLKVDEIGQWFSNNELQIEETYSCLRKSLEGVRFHGIQLKHFSNYCDVFDPPLEFKVALNGYGNCWHLEIAEYAATKYNFTVDYIELGGQQVIHGNKATSLGLTLLRNGTKEFCISPLLILVKDVHMLDFILLTYKSRSYMLLRPLTDNGKWSSYTKPFAQPLWLATLIWCGLSGVVLWFCSWVNNSEPFWNFGSVLTAVEALCSQAGTVEPTRNSSRFIYLTMFLVPTFLVPAYTASLLTYIYIQFNVLPFTNIQGFIDDGTYKLMVDFGSRFHIETSSDENTRKLRPHTTIVYPNYLWEDIERNLCSKRVVFIKDVSSQRLRPKEQIKCDLVQIPKPLFTILMALPVKKRWQYKKYFETTLTRFQEIGLIHLLNSKYVPWDLKWHQSYDYRPVTFQDLFPLFCIQIVGLTLAIFILYLERMLKFVMTHKISEYFTFGKEIEKRIKEENI